eukprot:CAMPEP_0182544262 /NCGR_PEP_ID=MMETSP1323-20130603/32863_1 /TAXON_ID=236787 /ORGANISM="Florenciella parvula, Strain RCC1693" /LENGTH=108 /DNA_ID=CAMNT_0024755275 /DNA_START=75 /DNA_END=396 /DNA_ORIENTATION=+
MRLFKWSHLRMAHDEAQITIGRSRYFASSEALVASATWPLSRLELRAHYPQRHRYEVAADARYALLRNIGTVPLENQRGTARHPHIEVGIELACLRYPYLLAHDEPLV